VGLGVWVVHIPFLIIALLMLNWQALVQSRNKSVRVAHA
jgi:lipopolysaccharide export system permease protein